jgi:diguanylate cyclase
LGRVGGEEFLIVLPETTQEQALEVAERLRKYIESKTCAISQGKDIHITVSIGLAMFNPEKEGLSESAAVLKTFYSACDQAMYRAKQAGRNQVCH